MNGFESQIMAEASDPSSSLSDELSSELEALGAIFAGEGEFVVEPGTDDGEYCCVVKVEPEGLAVGLQFSLPGEVKVTLKESCAVIWQILTVKL